MPLDSSFLPAHASWQLHLKASLMSLGSSWLKAQLMPLSSLLLRAQLMPLSSSLLKAQHISVRQLNVHTL